MRKLRNRMQSTGNNEQVAMDNENDLLIEQLNESYVIINENKMRQSHVFHNPCPKSWSTPKVKINKYIYIRNLTLSMTYAT